MQPARPDWYRWPGGREAMLRFGPDSGPVLVAALPLFEEANRTRALVVAVLRALADRGVASVLPDLPGQGDSPVPTVDARLADWRTAFAAATTAAAGDRVYGFAIRGGTLVDGAAALTARLHLESVAGRQLVRDLLRTRRIAHAAAGQSPVADDPRAAGPPLLLAGNRLDRSLLTALLDAEPTRADRVLALFPAADPADRQLAPGDPIDGEDRPRFRRPWTAAEPFADPALATLLADDIAAWIARCEA